MNDHQWGRLHPISPLKWGAVMEREPDDRKSRRCLACGVLQRPDGLNNPCTYGMRVIGTLENIAR